MDHPLDRPIWTALTTRQIGIAQEASGIRRFKSAFAPFAASAEGTSQSFSELAALVPVGETIYLQQSEEIAAPKGFIRLSVTPTVQMVAEQRVRPSPPFSIEELTSADAAQMLALALLTKPGPYAERTHELGRFVGIRCSDQLVAMAGERMKPGPYTEVSGVCTRPDHRGKGFAAAAMNEIVRAIFERGETPFLHAIASNEGAIALYERLGFTTRWRPVLMVLQRI